jgi:hypothetical protein
VYTVYRFKAVILYSSGSKWMAQPVSDTWHDTIAIHNWVSEVIKVGDTIRVQADEFPLWSDPAKMVWEYAEDVQNNRSQACDCSEHDDI